MIGLTGQAHVQISKQMPVNKQNQVILPINVYSATEDAACGILLEAEHEYLLAGEFMKVIGAD